MPFRKLKFQMNCFYLAPYLPVQSEDSNGNVVESVLSVNGDCPDVEDFRLKNLLAAGAPLDKVSTTLFKSGVADVQRLSDSYVAPTEPVSSNEKSEVKNEE